MKKAVIELQFNWIFVLIVGTVILAFFIGIVMKQKDISQERTGIKLSADLETIATGAEVSKGTAQVINIPTLEIEFRSEDCLRRYSIGGSTKQYRQKIIFAPSRIKGRELLAWTLDWNLPYRTTNFLYLTSPEMRYILVDRSPLALGELSVQVNKSLPREMQPELTQDTNTITDLNNYKVRLIYFNTNPGDVVVPEAFWSMKDPDVSALRIDSAPPYQTGVVEFYRKSSNTFVSTGGTWILGTQSLYGAIFTDDYEMYNCNMKEAFRKLGFVTQILWQRTNALYSNQNLSHCRDRYFSAQQSLENISVESLALYSRFPQGDSRDRIDGIYTAAFDDSRGLQGHNRNLQLQSCPEVY